MILKLQKFHHLLVNSEFAKNFFVLASGIGFSIVIQALAGPILTRMYLPQDIGIFTLFFNSIGLLSIMVTARSEMVIILPKTEDQAAALILASIIVSIIFSLIIMCGVTILYFTIKRHCAWLFFIPLACLFIGFFQISYCWLIRKKKFHISSLMKASQSILFIVMSFLFAFIFHSYWGIILSYVVEYVIVGSFALAIVVKIVRVYWRNYNIMTLFNFMKQYKKVLLYLNLADITEYFALYMPTFCLSMFFDSTTVGLYALAQIVTGAPVRLISTAVSDIFKQRASFEYSNGGQCNVIFIKVLILLTILASALSVIFFMVAPYIFNLVFGSAWKASGEYARILTVMMFFQFIVSPLNNNMFLISEKTKLKFFMQCYLIGSNFLSFWCGYYIFHSIKMSLILFVISNSVKYLIELVISYKLCFGASFTYGGKSLAEFKL